MNRDRWILLLASPFIVSAVAARAACLAILPALKNVRAAWKSFT